MSLPAEPALAATLHRTTCNRDCPDACSILATVEGGKVTRLQGDPTHPITQGFLCYRTSRLLDTPYYRERLTTPLLRQGDEFVPIGWEEALALAADRLRAIRRESGPAAMFHYRSGGSLGMVKAVCDRFWEAWGPVTVKRGDICSGAGDAAQEQDFGERESSDLFQLYNARNILLWGKNAYVSSPHTVPVLKEARRRGAELTLIDPVHHQTATLCRGFVQPRPGGDFALAMAVGRVLFARGWVDPGGASRCLNVHEFQELAESCSLSGWCADADVTEEEVTDLAFRLGPGKPCSVLIGWGMGRRGNGAGIIRAIDALVALTGNLGIPGGGAYYYWKRRGAFDTSCGMAEIPPPRTVCEPRFGADVLAAAEPPIRAVWITAGNPVVMLPESLTTAEALASREFVVVVDSALTDTARLAHLVLPTTTLLEADDLLGAYGHHTLGVARPVLGPPSEVRSDLQIVQGLATHFGLEEVVAGTAKEWKERILAPRLGPQGITLEKMESEPVRNPLAAEVLFADGRFPTPSGKVELVVKAPEELEGKDPLRPLWLMSLSTKESQSSQWTGRQEGEAWATVHPDAAPGFKEGDGCRLESVAGEMTVRLRFDSHQRRDVVLVPKGGSLREGRCANVLIRARLTDAGEGGALYDEKVRILGL